MSIQVRVFVDDFGSRRCPLAGRSAAADSAMARYLRGTFALADRTGRPVRLAWAGAEPAGDVILLRLRGEVPGGLAGARVTSLVLCERFEDQVNVVRAEYAGRTDDAALHPRRDGQGAAVSAAACGRSTMACRLSACSEGPRPIFGSDFEPWPHA